MHAESQKSDHSDKNDRRFGVDFSAHGVVVLNADGTIRYCNDVMLKWVGATPAQSGGQLITKFMPEWPLDIDGLAFGVALATTVSKSEILWLQALDGNTVPVRISVRSLRLDGERVLVVAIERIGRTCDAARLRDITQLKASAQINENAIVITDCNGGVESVNAAFEKMTGYSSGELIGKNLMDLQLEPQQIDCEQSMWAALSRGKIFSCVSVHRKKDGTLFHHEQSVRPFFDINGAITHAVFTGSDVSERIKSTQQLTYLANYDSLTGMPNRNLICDRLQQALKSAARSGKSFTIAMLDVDQFKSINDCYGHSIGDFVLREIAERVQGCVRAGKIQSDVWEGMNSY